MTPVQEVKSRRSGKALGVVKWRRRQIFKLGLKYSGPRKYRQEAADDREARVGRRRREGRRWRWWR